VRSNFTPNQALAVARVVLPTPLTEGLNNVRRLGSISREEWSHTGDENLIINPPLLATVEKLYGASFKEVSFPLEDDWFERYISDGPEQPSGYATSSKNGKIIRASCSASGVIVWDPRTRIAFHSNTCSGSSEEIMLFDQWPLDLARFETIIFGLDLQTGLWDRLCARFSFNVMAKRDCEYEWKGKVFKAIMALNQVYDDTRPPDSSGLTPRERNEQRLSKLLHSRDNLLLTSWLEVNPFPLVGHQCQELIGVLGFPPEDRKYLKTMIAKDRFPHHILIVLSAAWAVELMASLPSNHWRIVGEDSVVPSQAFQPLVELYGFQEAVCKKDFLTLIEAMRHSCEMLDGHDAQWKEIHSFADDFTAVHRRRSRENL
jgi:hypothetical protein